MSNSQGDDLDIPKSLLVPHEIVTWTGRNIGNGAYGVVYEVYSYIIFKQIKYSSYNIILYTPLLAGEGKWNGVCCQSHS